MVHCQIATTQPKGSGELVVHLQLLFAHAVQHIHSFLLTLRQLFPEVSEVLFKLFMKTAPLFLRKLLGHCDFLLFAGKHNRKLFALNVNVFFILHDRHFAKP